MSESIVRITAKIGSRRFTFYFCNFTSMIIVIHDNNLFLIFDEG